MGYTKKSLQELDVIDDFLSNAIAANEVLGEPFYRLLLSVLLQKKLKKIRIIAQRFIPGITPKHRGIRMDVEITEYEEERLTSVYDIEPHTVDKQNLPKHNRFYQAKVDGRYVQRGLKDFSDIPNLYVITITNYDMFDKGYMVYTVHNKCEEVPELEYKDGLQFIYFNTEGQRGGSQAIKNVLTYIQNSESKNVVDEVTREMDSYVKQVKSLPEVEAGYMTFGEYMDIVSREMKEDAKVEVYDEVVAQVQADLKGEALDEMKKKLRAELEGTVKDEMKKSVRAELEKKFRSELEEKIRDEIEKSVREELEKKFRSELEEKVRDEMEKRVRADLEEKVRDEMEKKIKDETEKAVKEAMVSIFIDTLQDYQTKEQVTTLIREKYPDFSGEAEKLVDKYWRK